MSVKDEYLKMFRKEKCDICREVMKLSKKVKHYDRGVIEICPECYVELLDIRQRMKLVFSE